MIAGAGSDGVPPFQTSSEAAPFKSVVRKANGSGIELSYQVEPAKQAPGAARITLRFSEVTDPAGASFRLDPDAGLFLAGSAPTTRALPAGQTTTFVIDVTQRGDTTGYLNVFTTQHGTTGVTSIPVQVGKLPSGLPGSTKLKQSLDGEKISPIPVK